MPLPSSTQAWGVIEETILFEVPSVSITTGPLKVEKGICPEAPRGLGMMADFRVLENQLRRSGLQSSKDLLLFSQNRLLNRIIWSLFPRACEQRFFEKERVFTTSMKTLYLRHVSNLHTTPTHVLRFCHLARSPHFRKSSHLLTWRISHIFPYGMFPHVCDSKMIILKTPPGFTS